MKRLGIFRAYGLLWGLKLIDTHTHIFLGAFDEDRDAVVSRARQAGVDYLLLPNVDRQTTAAVEECCRRYPRVLPMWGLHPCSVGPDAFDDLKEIFPLFSRFPACAVGEIGLDFYWSRTFEKEQIRVLEEQAEWALQLGLPVSLHTREATRATLDTLRPFALRGLKGVFHCFSGTEDEAREALGLGFFLGIGGSVTYRKNPLREFIAALPPESMVLETDAPYLPPVPHRGKRNEPAFLTDVAFELARLMNRPPGEIAEISSRNALSLFALEPH